MKKSIGQTRKFTNYNEPCEILEILDNPDFSMVWEWKKGKCPHCKEDITKKITHTFTQIEILIPQSKKEELELQKRFYYIGYGLDTKGKILFIPNRDILRILPQTKKLNILGGIV